MNQQQHYTMKEEHYKMNHVSLQQQEQQKSVQQQQVNLLVDSNKICYFCGSTKHASSDCPMYA